VSRTRHHGSKLKAKLFGDHWNWMRVEPKDWRNVNKHRKRRAAVRRSLLSKDWDNQVFPLDKKPWVYYW
jgi:hypothetical protein